MNIPRDSKRHIQALRRIRRKYVFEQLESRLLLATGFSVLDMAQVETKTNAWTSIASADFLKDGASDVVLGGWIEDSSYQIAMHQKGAGAVSLRDRTYVNTNHSLTGTGVGDIDNDGVVDILLGNNWNSGSPNVLPLIGDGSGGFQRSDSRSNGGFFTPTYVSTFDFDMDGINEIVTSNYNDDSLSVIDSSGGSIRIPLSPDYGANGGNHLIMDVNGDGRADLVSAVGDPDGTSTPGLAVAKQNGDGGFGSTEFLVRPGAFGQVYADYVDLNNDEAPEILVADSLQGAVLVYINDGLGVFSAGGNLILEPNVTRIHVLNRPTATDPTICIATVSKTEGIKLFFRNEIGTWEKSGEIPIAGKFSSVGDFNGDGTLDIVAIDSNGTLTFAYLTRNRAPTISDSLIPDFTFGNQNELHVTGVWPRLYPISGGRFAITSTGSNTEDSFAMTVDIFRSDGSPDPSFGTNGRLRINPREQKSGARGLMELSDGSFLLVGDPNYGYGQDDWSVVKITKSGDLDSSFGSGGIVNLDVPEFGLVDSVAVDSEGRILLTGKTHASAVLSVTRLSPTGSLDSSFGNSGWRHIDLGNSMHNSVAYSKVIPSSDGTFFVKTGREYQAALPKQSILLQFDSNGNIIKDFRLGLGSEVRSDDAIIDANGRILVVGTVGNDVFLIRYDRFGEVDPSFGTNGLVRRSSITFSGAGSGLSIDQQNRIYFAYLSSDSKTIKIERILSDGSTDKSFAIGGTFSVEIGEVIGGDGQWLDFITTQDGSFVFASPNSNWNSYVKKYISEWRNITLHEDSDLCKIPLRGISAGLGENQPIKVTVTSGNMFVVSSFDISYNSPDDFGHFTFKPNADSFGTTEVVVKVEDGGVDGSLLTTQDNSHVLRTVSVQVQAVNDPPVLPVIDDLIILEDAPEQFIAFNGVNAGPFEDQRLRLTVTSSNESLIPKPTINFDETNRQGGIRLKSNVNMYGKSIITVEATDGGEDNDLATDADNLSVYKSFTVTVTPVNDAPTDITLTPNSIPENAAPNSTVGTLRSIDPDTGNTFSYALVAGLGDNDNSAFRISGSLLRTSQSFDYEARSSYSIRVKSTDQGGLSTQKVFVINVTDVNDAPRFVDPEYEFEVADGTRQDNGSQANNGQWRPSISRDGRFVAFVSYATNLAANDFEMDVFVKDTFSGNVVEVSNTQSGGRSNGDSFNPTITPDGRFVVFESYASNLVPEDTSPTGDIFLRDLHTGTIERISTSSTGTAGNDRSYSPSVSDDGRFVAFRSDANNLVDGDTNGKGDIFIKDRLTGELSRVSNAFDGSQGNNHSFEPAVSGDGNKVAFRSYASNLVAGTDNNFEDIYVKDLRTGTILRANTSTDGQQGNNAVWVPSLSYDGRFLSFPSTATNLVPGDTNAAWDVFLKDLNTGETTRVSTTVNGTQGNGASNYATISGDGRYVTFLSSASNLVSDDTNGKEDVFIKDTLTGTITRVSTSSERTQANDSSSEAFVSAAGNLVAFTSTATNLVPNDTNGVPDIFIKNLITGEAKLVVGNNSRVLIGQVSGTDQDANSVLRYTLTGPGADAFVINPITGEIELSSTGVMDFNLQPTYALTALVSDGVLSSTVPVTILVTNGNNRPTDILLSSSSIEENMEENTLVGTLSVLDPNPGDLHVYQLVEGLGSDNNASFIIEGTNLRAVGSFDFETKSSYSIRIRATDQGDLFKEKIFTIRVTDVDEGFPLLGTTANDAFVATYTGDGIVHAWSVTRNGTLLFNGTLPNTSLLIDGLGGTDTLDVVGRIADDVIQLDGSQLFINTAKLRFPRIESIRIQAKEGSDSLTVTTPLPSGVTGSFDGGTGLDLLEAIAGTNIWNVLGTDSGSLNSNLTFTATESIQGGANDDQFVLSALGKTTGKILGGGGIDTLSLAAKTLAHTINLQTNTATSTGGIGGIESFIGSTSATVFDVLIGANSDTNWNIQGTDQGTLSSAVSGTISFTGFENLTGGTSRDSFVFSNAGRLTKTLTGGTATGVIDTIDLSEKTAALEFRLDGTSTSVPGSIGTYTGVERLTGNNHANSKVSRSSNTTTMWTVDAFGNIVVLGATYANVPMIAGGPGTDTLTGPSLASSAVQWIIDSANRGSISLPSIKTLAFTSMNGLTGGTGDDVFEIQPAGSISSNLSGGTGTGINALSYSQWTSGVSVNLSVGTAANATAIGGITSNFQMITGGSGDDSLRGNASKTTVLIGLAGNDSLVGGTQRDIIVGGLGNDLLQGGNGDDLLISGRTSYDLNFNAMKGVLAEWTSTRTFAQRTANLCGNGTGTRSNSNYFLNSQSSDDITDTVFADADNDSLSGGLNQDWFFASLNDLTDFTGTGTAPDRLDP